MTSTINWAPTTTPGSRSVTDGMLHLRASVDYVNDPDFNLDAVRIEYRKINPYLKCPSPVGHLFVPRYDPVLGSTKRCGLCDRSHHEVLHHHEFAAAYDVDTCVYRELALVYYSPKAAALYAIADCGAVCLWMD